MGLILGLALWPRLKLRLSHRCNRRWRPRNRSHADVPGSKSRRSPIGSGRRRRQWCLWWRRSAPMTLRLSASMPTTPPCGAGQGQTRTGRLWTYLRARRPPVCQDRGASGRDRCGRPHQCPVRHRTRHQRQAATRALRIRNKQSGPLELMT